MLSQYIHVLHPVGGFAVQNAFLHFCVAAYEKQRSLSITISTEIGD